MQCATRTFDTGDLFTTPAPCAQQFMEVQDTTKLRFGNPTGYPRVADRDITNFQPANNGPDDFASATGNLSNRMRYSPSTAKYAENPTTKFVNLGYTSPASWKESLKKPTSGTTKKEKFNIVPTTATNAYYGPHYNTDYLDKNKEGYCPCTRRSYIRFDCRTIFTCVVIILLCIGLYAFFNQNQQHKTTGGLITFPNEAGMML